MDLANNEYQAAIERASKYTLGVVRLPIYGSDSGRLHAEFTQILDMTLAKLDPSRTIATLPAASLSLSHAPHPTHAHLRNERNPPGH